MAAALQVVAAVVALMSVGLSAAYAGPHLPRRHMYCVTPTNSTVCHCDGECHTLQFYLENLNRYFRDYTTFLFTRGNHTLAAGNYSTPWIINIFNLTLKGDHGVIPGPYGTYESSSQIHCNGTAGFTFKNVTVLRLEYLTFIGCGGVPDYDHKHHYKHAHSSLYFTTVMNLDMFHITIRNGTGWGVEGFKVLGTFSIINSHFANNNGGRTFNGGNMDLYYLNCTKTDSTHLYIRDSEFLYGNSNFSTEMVQHQPRQYAGGLGVLSECSNVALEIENVKFSNNRGNRGGNLAIGIANTNFVHPVKIKNCMFLEGVAELGAGVYMTVSQLEVNCTQVDLLHISNSTFRSNIGFLHGSGLYLYTAFENISSLLCTGGVFTVENCTFERNQKGYDSRTGGIAVHAVSYIPDYYQQGVLKLIFKKSTFSGSYYEHRLSYNTAVYVDSVPYISFEDCNFTNNTCTGLFASGSNVIFKGNIIISRNIGNNGGGLMLGESSLMYLSPNTTVLFSDNHARSLGGAIYVPVLNFLLATRCFFQPFLADKEQADTFLGSVFVRFQNNSAGVSGDALYGSSVDLCYMLEGEGILSDSTNDFNNIFILNNSINDPSLISSDPMSLCFCENNAPQCAYRARNISSLPGQRSEVSLVVVGQRNGTVPGFVIAAANDSNITLPPGENFQAISTRHCTSLQYTASSKYQTISLSAQTYSSLFASDPGNPSLYLHFRYESCPFGFFLYHDSRVPSCKCKYGLNCSISGTDGVVHRMPSRWIGTCPTAIHGFARVDHCPFGMCTSKTVNIYSNKSSLVNPDVQCASHRTGTVCGACKPGYSLTLGGNQCRKCSNKYIPVVLSFAVGGLLLVVILTALNLTVTEGAINGLIFYANIVQVNANLFFPPLPDNSVLKILASIPKVFIAWVNLDMGIDMCFYDGLDAYTKTWLEFAFPIYIWVIAGVIVLLSRRYTIVARATGRHAVQVLATLFLLSFAKLLSTVIVAMKAMSINCGTNGTAWVWEPNGTINYLTGIHIPLFLAGLVATVFFAVPYCLILIFAQCLQRLRCQIIWRLKPLFDAYTGPYKDVARFWTGHLVLLRGILFVTNASTERTHPMINLFLVVVVSIHLLLLSVWVFRGVYKKYSLDILESTFVLNLAILTIVALLNPEHPKSLIRVIAIYSSTTTALITTVGIFIYHGYRQLMDGRQWMDVLLCLSQKRCPEMERAPLLRGEDNATSSDSEQSQSQHLPARAAMMRFDEYREPVLGFEDRT